MAAVSAAAGFLERLWTEEFWLPVNATWEQVRAGRNQKFMEYGEMYLCLPVAVILIIIRVVFERFIASPVVKFLGVKERVIVFEPNPFCEKVFQTISKHPNQDRIEGLSKQLAWSTARVERWFRHRRKQSQPSTLKKATETSWRFVVYLSAVIYGTIILRKEKWLWKPTLCFVDYGKQDLTDDIFFFYLMEMALYVSLLISVCVDVKRKDFWPMSVHHIVTIMLLAFSFYTGFFRIGAVIILLHDVADIFLEGAKVFHYAKRWETVATVGFFVFAITFFITRLVLYPFWVLHAVYLAPSICGPFKSWKVFFGLLASLQVLHLYWFCHIANMFFSFTAAGGKLEKDVRSDESSSDGDAYDDDEKPAQDGASHDNKKKQ